MTSPRRLRDAPPLDVRLLQLLVLLSVSACGSPTGAGDDPPKNDPVVNDRVENASGIHVPESCSAPGSSIVPLGNLDLPGRLFDVWAYYDPATDREYALAGFQSSETSGGGLYVIDVTDPTEPVAVGTFPSGHNLFVSDRGYLYKAAPGVAAYDLVPDPAAPDLIWSDARAGGHDVTVIDDVLLDFHDFEGTRLYDVTDPFSPATLGVLDSDSVRFHHSGWMSGDRAHLYITDELASDRNRNPDITVWDVDAEEIVGTFRDTLSTVHNSYELCDRLVVAYYTRGLVLLDVSDPLDPSLLDAYDTDPEAEAPGVFRGAFGAFPYTRSGNVLVSDVDRGLFVFRLE